MSKTKRINCQGRGGKYAERSDKESLTFRNKIKKKRKGRKAETKVKNIHSYDFVIDPFGNNSFFFFFFLPFSHFTECAVSQTL